ncbi:MAG TPA: hypothetical protein VFG55_08085 [Rhodanobacteraceae bacterium]|nr:hypothetical protein [Rhodanobacteraceae bacterium]
MGAILRAGSDRALHVHIFLLLLLLSLFTSGELIALVMAAAVGVAGVYVAGFLLIVVLGLIALFWPWLPGGLCLILILAWIRDPSARVMRRIRIGFPNRAVWAARYADWSDRCTSRSEHAARIRRIERYAGLASDPVARVRLHRIASRLRRVRR